MLLLTPVLIFLVYCFLLLSYICLRDGFYFKLNVACSLKSDFHFPSYWAFGTLTHSHSEHSLKTLPTDRKRLFFLGIKQNSAVLFCHTSPLPFPTVYSSRDSLWLYAATVLGIIALILLVIAIALSVRCLSCDSPGK